MQNKLTCLKGLTSWHQNTTKCILSCSKCKSLNSDLLTRIIQLEHNAVTNSQYSRQETTESSPVPAEIHEDVLEESIYNVLSLKEVNVVPEDLDACHHIKRSDRIIVKSKCGKQKQSLIFKHRNLGTKSQELTNFKFLGRLFVGESMFHEN